MNIILLGPPGSGKGTQGESLEKSLNIKRISTGDMLRNEVNSNSDLGKQVQSIISSGRLVSDDVIMRLLELTIKSSEYENGFILDGVPRSLGQAVSLDNLLEGISRSIDLVLYFSISDEVLIDRICNRYYCANCGTNYNKAYKNPKIQGKCDVCGGGEFKIREDDNIDSVKKRMSEYRSKTEPLVEYYKNKGILKLVNCDQDVEKISKDIDLLLKND